MPSLVAFGQRWGVGSDDLAVPAALEAAASATWLLTFGRTLYHQYGSLPAAPWAPAVRQLYISSAILQSFNILVLGCLVHNSFLGTVVNAVPRHRASYFLGIKLVYQGVLVCLSVAAMRLVYFTDLSSAPPHLVNTVRNASRGLWCTTIISSIVMWHILNPYKRKPYVKRRDHVKRDLEHTQSVPEAMKGTWKERFHSLGKFLGIEGHPALNKVGRLFSEYLQETSDVDLVATDVIAAFMILHKEQKQRLARIARKSPSLGLTEPLPPEPQPWMTVHEAAHYMKYAAGGYGWPMYIWSSPLALWGLGRVLVRSSWEELKYLPRSLPCNVVDDNALMANTTVIKMVTGLTDDQLVIVSFHNKLFEVPFYVALDHEEKSVVVSIRGTLSFEDILTNLSAYDNIDLDIPGVEGALAHEGIYFAAVYIMGRLLGTGPSSETGLLEQALDKVKHGTAKDYGLVIVGHSLGAGVAGILALLMRPHKYYGPRLRCFAYSPPGGLLSESASTYCEPFVCSVVLGDDIVSRIGLSNIHDLKAKIFSTVRDLDIPKHQIFQGWFRNLLNKALGVSERELLYTKDKHSWSHDPREQTAAQHFQNGLQTSIDWSKRMIEHREQMYPPGCVMYLEELSKTRFSSTFVAMNSYLFGEIILSKTIIKHHTPWAVLHALRQLAQQ